LKFNPLLSAAETAGGAARAVHATSAVAVMKIKARVLKRCEFSVTCHDVEQDSAVRYLRVGTAALSDSVTSDGSNL
jgi:hypothetical protein